MPINTYNSSYSYLGTSWPSGQIGSGVPGHDLEAYLISLRAQFGFNDAQHQFEMDFIPIGSGYGHGASGQLAPINTDISMWVSGFYLRGLISHIDWHSTNAGTVLNVALKDRRITLDQYKITTEDIGSGSISGLASVAQIYRISNGITQTVTRSWVTSSSGTTSYTDIESNDPNFKEYVRIVNDGATYAEILTAINATFGSGLINQLPTVSDIQSNIGGDINSLRFKFNSATLREVMTQLTLQTAFDWYWNMGGDKVNLINKKTPFLVPETKILTFINAFGASGIDNVKSIAYGKDVVEEPNRIQLLGAKQEGMLNSPLLSPIDGLDTYYDGIAPSSTLVFHPGWPLLSVSFYDASGFYRTYVPQDKELQMAIAGEEQWTYYKKYQTASAPSGWGLPADDGSIAAQHPDFQSRLDPRQPISQLLSNPSGNIRVINNRRDLNSNWTKEFFNRVNQHAQRHYGKSYVATNALLRNDRVFTLIDAAWCNVENQRQIPSGLFIDDYEISRQYGPIAPFLIADAKVKGHVKLPSGTVYGPLGEDSPASFSNWTEDAYPFNPSGDGSHYIPCELAIVGSRVQDPRRDDQYSFEVYPEQTLLCQLPEIASSGLMTDNVLASLSTLTEYALALQESGLIDLIDPRRLITPYYYLSGVAVPVQSAERYGQTYPSPWVSGNVNPIFGTKITVDDNLAPWIEFPEGTESSIDKLSRHANDKIAAEISSQTDSQFLEINQVGLPAVSFDSFATQTPNISGLVGERQHGVNSVSVDYGVGGLTTTYKIQSYYSTIHRPNPLTDRTRFRINGVLNPIDFTDLGNFLASFGKGTTPLNNLQHGLNHHLLNFDYERQEACEVIAIHNIFGEAECRAIFNGQSVPTEEGYYAIVKRQRAYGYGETNYTLNVGLNNVGHNLNSLQVIVSFIASGIGNIVLPYTVLDPFTVAVANNTGSPLYGTIMISNGEGVIRPTNADIRNSDEIDDYGAKCNDGFLNLGDPCVYVSKRADGEFLGYFTGGRPLNNGMIVQIERNEGNGLYSCSIVGDRHSRWLAGIPILNNSAVSIGTQGPVAPTA